jgi:hypothetical protein
MARRLAIVASSPLSPKHPSGSATATAIVTIPINVPDTTQYKPLSSHSCSAKPMANTNLNIQVLQASVDPDDESEFRILVGGEFTKYLTINAGLYELDEMCFAPSLIPLLPPLPPGDWNMGRISKDPIHGRPFFCDSHEGSTPKDHAHLASLSDRPFRA